MVILIPNEVVDKWSLNSKGMGWRFLWLQYISLTGSSKKAWQSRLTNYPNFVTSFKDNPLMVSVIHFQVLFRHWCVNDSSSRISLIPKSIISSHLGYYDVINESSNFAFNVISMDVLIEPVILCDDSDVTLSFSDVIHTITV